MAELRLEPVTRDNVRAACDLRLRPDQEHLVAPVAYSLAEAYVAADIAWPRLIYDGDELVGFIMGAFDPPNPDDLFHAYLWRLNISRRPSARSATGGSPCPRCAQRLCAAACAS